MEIMYSALNAIETTPWLIVAVPCSLAYLLITAIMIKTAAIGMNRKLQIQKVIPKYFYWGQFYLAFFWPIPLFLVIDFL
jgi:hypothetical protein